MTTKHSDLPTHWKLTHWYPSSDDAREESEVHEMESYWQQDTLVLESQPQEDGSYMLVRLHFQDEIVSGGWYETASPAGKNASAQYSGQGQLLLDPKTYRMEGMWAGVGYDYTLKKMRVYTGKWEIVPTEEARQGE